MNREVKRGKQSINKLCRLESKEKVGVENPEEIERMTVSFFHAVFNGYHRSNGKIADTPYEPNFDGLDSFLQGLGTLLDLESENMISGITLEEVEEAIKESSSNKAPGLDGLTYELFKNQRNKLAPKLVGCFQRSALNYDFGTIQ